MTYHHFYDKDAAPVPGKSPVQMRVKGGPASSTVQAGVNAALNAFLAGSRISEAPNLQKTVALPDGTTVRMRARFGQVIVDVAIPPRSEELEEKEDFYGGIVIRPYCISNEADYLPSVPGTVAQVDFTLPEVTTAGVGDGKGGRPAVPGTTPADLTTHIVIQIRNDVPLDDAPVARGYVKIWRIKDPLVGRHTQVGPAGTYLVSANETFTEFYLCGKRLTRVPALPVSVATVARIAAYRFTPQSFATAASARGWLFVAVDKKLYGLDAGAASPAWQLLDTTVFDSSLAYANDFGDTVTTTLSPEGAVQLVCTGSNGAGICSGFTATITPAGVGVRPTLSGVVTLMHDGTVPAVPQTFEYTATLSNEGTNFSGTSMSVTADWTEHTFDRSDVQTTGAGAMPLLPDRFLGGTLPRYDAVGSSIVETATAAGTFDGWVSVLGIEQPSYSTTYTYERVKTQFGGSKTDTITYTAGATVHPTTPAESITFARAFTAPSSLAADPVQRHSYIARDSHTGKMAWRRSAQRSATFTDFPAQTGPSVGETLSLGVPGTVHGAYAMDGLRTTSYSALAFEYELLRPSGAQLLAYTSLAEMFTTTPAWSGAYDDDQTGLKYEDLPTNSLFWGPFSSSGSPLNVSTTPFYGIEERGTVGVHRPIISGGPEINIGGPSPYGGGPTFSYLYEFTPVMPTSYALADYIALWTPSMINDPAYPLYAYPLDTIFFVGPVSTDVAPIPDSGVYAPHGSSSKISYESGIRFDLRTRGFIAWAMTATEMSMGVWARHFVALIGNDVSTVPLRDVLDEWRALGVEDTASDLKTMFYEAPAEVTLL